MVDLPPTMFGKSPPNLPNPLMNVSQQPGRTHENSPWVQDHQTFFSFNLRRFQSWLQAVLFSSWRFGQLQPFPKTPKPSFGGWGWRVLGPSRWILFFCETIPATCTNSKVHELNSCSQPKKPLIQTGKNLGVASCIGPEGICCFSTSYTRLGKALGFAATGRLGFDDPTCHDRIWIPIIGYMWLVCLPTWMVDFHRCR